MALVHERLYRSQGPARVDLTDYVESLATNLFHSYQANTDRIGLEVDVHGVRLSIDSAVPCGLLVNELISNCLKHAFSGRDRGRIRVELTPVTEGDVLLSVSDDGVGLPPDRATTVRRNLRNAIDRGLVDQLHGRVQVNARPGPRCESCSRTDEASCPRKIT